MNLFDPSIEENAGGEFDKLPDETKGGNPLGLVVGGSLSEGVEVRLDPSVSTEEVQVGNFVTLRGQQQRFFGMIGDVGLGSTDNRLRSSPPDVNNPLVHEVLAGTVAFGTFQVRPRLILPQIAGAGVPHLEGQDKLPTARTVPPHFSIVSKASDMDISQVFGREDERRFWIGNPLDMETKICLDMEIFVQLSNGVFGKSGTGKSFLTRLLLTGIIQKTEAASLVFDMHSEYGWSGGDPERGREVKGLKQLFPSKVAVFTLDPESSLARKVPIEAEIRLAYSEIQPKDIELLAATLHITPLGIQAVYRLPRFLGSQWLEHFINPEGNESLIELADRMGETVATLGALQRRLLGLSRMPFLVSNASSDPLKRILECLERGTHVVLEFGTHGRSLEAYILVANLLTRRIFDLYSQRSLEAEGNGRPKPRPLVICIEEAHRFLDPSLADQTIFGTIAREGRKSNLTLLIIDQRPSGIDREVRSQLGTRIVYPLDDELDTEAVLAGVAESRELRNVLASLASRQQVLIFGNAVPIPVVVRVREYGSASSYEELTRSNDGPRTRGPRPGVDARQSTSAKDAEDDLFG
jgi:DNA helicase HerA-like ATPase